MINVLFAVDDGDHDLGDYFLDSYLDISYEIDKIDGYSEALVCSENCTQESVLSAIENYEDSRFLFVGICHGIENELNSNHGVIVGSEIVDSFINSFFYTTACFTGRQLGQDLIDAGCSTYIGFTIEVHIHPDYEDRFMDCENHALKVFCKSGNTAKEAFNSMIDKFDEVIEDLAGGDISDTIVASTLVDNREGLIFLGNQDLRLSDLVAN